MLTVRWSQNSYVPVPAIAVASDQAVEAGRIKVKLKLHEGTCRLESVLAGGTTSAYILPE